MSDEGLLAFLDAFQTATTDAEWIAVERALGELPPSVERDTLAKAASAMREKRAGQN